MPRDLHNIILDARTGSHAPGLSWYYAPLDGVLVVLQYYVVGEKRGRDNHNIVHDVYAF